jgi:hypothetical protein
MRISTVVSRPVVTTVVRILGGDYGDEGQDEQNLKRNTAPA